MTLVLDTDHMTLLERGGPASVPLRERLAELADEGVATTIISYEEQMRGWMAFIARTKSLDEEIAAYARLKRHLVNYREVPVLDFDSAAAEVAKRLRRARNRLGQMDLKIAAITLAIDGILLSRNLKDFRRVTGLRVEDWSRPVDPSN